MINEILVGCVALIIILYLVILVRKKNLWINSIERRLESNRDKNKELIEENKEYASKNREKSLSIKNYNNAILFKNDNILYKGTFVGKRHIDFYNLKDGQEIVIIFDEEYACAPLYFDQKVRDNKEKFITGSKIKCTCFIDGNIADGLISDIYVGIGTKRTSIEYFDTEIYKDRGLGTCIINSLCKILKELKVDQLHAGLSYVDYPVRDKLYNFYEQYNGFKIEREVTETSWGLAIKYII